MSFHNVKNVLIAITLMVVGTIAVIGFIVFLAYIADGDGMRGTLYLFAFMIVAAFVFALWEDIKVYRKRKRGENAD